MQVRRDPRTRFFVKPTRIVAKEEARLTQALLEDNDEVCLLPPGSWVILDFGRELHGGVRLDIPTTQPKGNPLVRVRFGESVSETMGLPDQDHAIHDYRLPVAWMGRTEIGETGFRFVRLDNVDPGITLSVRAVEAVHLIRDEPWQGSFACSDERLNAIWETGAYTVHLCMQDHVWDGIKRDRLVWIGDLHPEAMVVATVFGNHEIVPASLDYVRDQTPLLQWMNGISSYSLWWLLIQADWYARFGDQLYLEQQRRYLMSLLERVLLHVRPDGSEFLGGHRFLEWPTSEDPEAIAAGLQALVVLTLQRGAWLCTVLGEDGLARRCKEASDKARKIQRLTSSKQAQALVVLAGMQEAQSANWNVLAVNPYRGLSTFYGYCVLEARARAGDIIGCLNLIRHYWGGMLDLGATTFWEGFELDWKENATRIDELPLKGKHDIHAEYGNWCYKGIRHSLCHGWAAGPTAWLTQWVLGITSAEPGMAKIHCKPHLGDLSWARGTVPTPYGLVTVEHQKQADGTIETTLTLPDGVAAI
ncbi:MAG: alpha-L-rhamnosidase [Armatimonadetes bacterium]|nr:alpha-L-rhamnosidase [Armatimonadota bacterium]